jgi:hypothetical protein
MLYENKLCPIYGIELIINEKGDEIFTISRKEKRIGYIKSNCMISCMRYEKERMTKRKKMEEKRKENNKKNKMKEIKIPITL